MIIYIDCHYVLSSVHRSVFDQWNKHLSVKERKAFPDGDQQKFPGLDGGSGTTAGVKSSGGRSGRCA